MRGGSVSASTSDLLNLALSEMDVGSRQLEMLKGPNDLLQ